MEKIIEHLSSRYAVKKFDAEKKINPILWNQFLDALVLTPSSYGLQPWKFIVIENQALREQLVEHSWGQKQVSEASHFIVFCALNSITEEYIDKYLSQVAKVRNISIHSLDGFKKMLVGNLITKPLRNISEWAINQVYIALGNALTIAPMMGLDATPIEGFSPEKYDEILSLPAKGLHSCVALAVGYKHHEDSYAKLPKVRFDKSDVVLSVS